MQRFLLSLAKHQSNFGSISTIVKNSLSSIYVSLIRVPISLQVNYQTTQQINMSIISGCSCGSRRANASGSVSVDIWDPFQKALTSSPRTAAFSDETAAFVKAQIDWKESPEAHIFKAELPGLKKHEVKVQVEKGRVLQISGERSIEKEDENDKWRCFERSSCKFLRRFSLPENAKVDKVKFSVENGVLTVIVPKAKGEFNKSGVKVIHICS